MAYDAEEVIFPQNPPISSGFGFQLEKVPNDGFVIFYELKEMLTTRF